MAENAFVTWAATPEPWLQERQALATLDLPLCRQPFEQFQTIC